MRAVGILWLAAAAEDGAVSPDGSTKYMTAKKAREIAKEKLPASMHELDARLGIIQGTAIFQLGKIDRLIPIALLDESGDMTVADAIPGSKLNKAINLANVSDDLQAFCDEKEADLKSVEADLKKKKGTVVDYQLIDDMANDPGHPWIHSATYNKTATSRKLEAVRTVLQSWVDSLNQDMSNALQEYIPPSNITAEEVYAKADKNATARVSLATLRGGLEWMKNYQQCTRIVLVAAQLLKKFTAKSLTEGMRINEAPLTVPMNVKDYLNLMELASSKVSNRMQLMVDRVAKEANQEIKGNPHKVSSWIETASNMVASAFDNVDTAIKGLRAVVLREHDALKAGFLPKASSLLKAYAEMVAKFNNANNATRAALKLPPTYLSYKINRADVMNAILHGEMAQLFYGKKLAPGQQIKDWPGIKAEIGENGTVKYSTDVQGAPDKYKELRADYEKRTPGFAAFSREATQAAMQHQLSVGMNADGSGTKL